VAPVAAPYAAPSLGATFAAGGTDPVGVTAPAPAELAAPPPATASPATAAAPSNGSLSDADVDRIARRVVELIGEQAVREVAWEVVPDMAELVIKDRLRELERQLDVP
jgi:hypothetical protein